MAEDVPDSTATRRGEKGALDRTETDIFAPISVSIFPCRTCNLPIRRS